MAITITPSGSAENSDLISMTIERTSGGDLVGSVEYRISTPFAGEASRRASWVLSTAEKQAVINNLLAGAKAAIEGDLGL